MLTHLEKLHANKCDVSLVGYARKNHGEYVTDDISRLCQQFYQQVFSCTFDDSFMRAIITPYLRKNP